MVERFEDPIAWQKARALTSRIYEVTRAGEFAKDYALSRQIQRVVASVMANIAQGFESGNRGEFQRFLFIAKSSCAEVRCELYIAPDVGYLSPELMDSLL